MDKSFERDILGRLTRREFDEWVHCLRVLLQKLGTVLRTKREANRMGMFMTHELRRIVRIRQGREEEKRL